MAKNESVTPPNSLGPNSIITLVTNSWPEFAIPQSQDKSMDDDTLLHTRSLSAVSAATMGPKNNRHILIKSMDTVSLTSSSRYYINQMCTQHNHNPLLKIFLQVLNSHHKTQGDAGWLCIFLACQLMSKSSQQQIPVSSLIQGLNQACQAAVAELTSAKTPVSLTLDWGEPSQVISVLMSIFRPHQSTTGLSEEDMHNLATDLLSAFIGSLSDGRSGSLSAHVVFYSTSLTLHGADPCQHLEGTLLLDIPLPRAFPPRGAHDVLVAVFEHSLELPEQLTDMSIEVSSPLSIKTLEYTYMEKMCDILVRSGVGLVCCQRRIHPHLQRLLSRKGIVCLPRLSVRYVSAVLQLSGAKQLGAFPQLQTLPSTDSISTFPLCKSSFGYLHRVYIMYTGNKALVALQHSKLYDSGEDCEEEGEGEAAVVAKLLGTNCSAPEVLDRRVKLSTLLLMGFHDSQTREIEGVCTGAMRVLTQLINGSQATVLSGGGCWQAYIARHVRGEVTRLEQEEKDLSTSKELADLTTIDDEAGLFSLVSPASSRDMRRAMLLFCEVVASCATVVGNGSSESGPSVNCFKSVDALDALSPCVSALQVAVEAVTSVVGVDGILT